MRGHNADRLTLKPSFGNLILWKSIYQHKETFYVDAIPPVQSSTWCSGDTIRVFDYKYHLTILIKRVSKKRISRDFVGFQDYLGYYKEKCCCRCALFYDSKSIVPMWGLTIDEQWYK